MAKSAGFVSTSANSEGTSVNNVTLPGNILRHRKWRPNVRPTSANCPEMSDYYTELFDGHSVRKWRSSSIAFMEHFLQSLVSRGLPRHLPRSVSSGYTPALNIANVFLCTGGKSTYISLPGTDLSSLYVLSLGISSTRARHCILYALISFCWRSSRFRSGIRDKNICSASARIRTSRTSLHHVLWPRHAWS